MADGAPSLPDAEIDGALDDIETWFVERGLPHFVERSTDGSVLDAWTRALPLLVGAYLLLGFNALDLRNWTFAQNLAAAAVVIMVLIAVWALSNRLRNVATFARPTDIDAPELVLFVVGPALPVLLFGQPGDALESVALALVLLALIYLWSSYGVGPLLRWGARRGSRQLASLGSLVARALPLLLLFNTFLFVNAEVWEMAGTLDGPAYFIVIFTFFALGATFALSRVPGTIRGVNDFEQWEDVDRILVGTPAEPLLPILPPGAERAPASTLRFRQRLNIGLVVLFGQALQITLVTAALTGFFIGFGFLGITESTALGWTRLDELHILFETSLGDRQLILSEPLIRVSVFLGAFSGMYFTVVLTTDDTYRSEFTDEAGPEIREALAVRAAYRVARDTEQAPELT
ncbi:hypothetical protein [Ilumatobacter sp.]|uniref:hypothetical protein n=1 Tax=Ilumatobacter sp. TaxID=1967498 RepID=UPI003C6AA271